MHRCSQKIKGKLINSFSNSLIQFCDRADKFDIKLCNIMRKNQMTKQEYIAEVNAASISEAASIINRAMHGSYITLMDVTKAEMEHIHRAFNVMNDRIASLKRECQPQSRQSLTRGADE